MHPNKIASEQPGIVISGGVIDHRFAERYPVRINKPERTAYKGTLRMQGKPFQTCFQGIGHKPVVGVEEHKKIPFTMTDPHIPRSRKSAVWLFYILYLRELMSYFTGIVAGTIIDHYYFVVRITLL
jgi:hypothetical protein